MDRKEAALSLAPDLPMTPDPRGTRFGGLEGPLRGLAIVEAELDPGALRLELAPDPDGEPAVELLVGTREEEAKRANLVLRSRGKGAEGAEETRRFRRRSECSRPGRRHTRRAWLSWIQRR